MRKLTTLLVFVAGMAWMTDSAFAMGRRRPVTENDHFIRCTTKLEGGGKSVNLIDLKEKTLTQTDPSGPVRKFTIREKITPEPEGSGATVDVFGELVLDESNRLDIDFGEFSMTGSPSRLVTHAKWEALVIEMTRYRDGRIVSGGYMTKCAFLEGAGGED